MMSVSFGVDAAKTSNEQFMRFIHGACILHIVFHAMVMMSAFTQADKIRWFIALVHSKNVPRVIMSLHSHTLYRISKSTKDRQHSGHMKKGQMDKQRYTIHTHKP